jgi:hypothetical protein
MDMELKYRRGLHKLTLHKIRFPTVKELSPSDRVLEEKSDNSIQRLKGP